MDSNRDLRGWPDDAVCYESHGRWFAIYFRRQREIHVFELPSGELRYTTSTKLDRHRDVDDVFRFSADGEQLWWRDEESQEWIVDTGNFAPPARFAGGPPMRRAEATRLTCVDGLLEIEGACAPVEDSTIVVTDGGRSFVGARDHYRLIR
jgi:hypothetical protein